MAERVQDLDVHQWTPLRFKVLGAIRQDTINRAMALAVDYYFVVDCDNYLRPDALSALVDARLPVVAPLLHRVAVLVLRPRTSSHHVPEMRAS